VSGQTNTFETAANMTTPRSSHSSALLPNGKLLILGGVNLGTALTSAELYDPATNRFAVAGDTKVDGVPFGLPLNTATLLKTGQLLVVDDGVGTSAEIYDSVNGRYARTGSMSAPRTGHTATLLLSGDVLLAGGNRLASAELYRPSSGTFVPTAQMSTARWGHTATILSSGEVLIAGGRTEMNGAVLASADVYDPATGRFRPTTGTMITERWGHTATLLRDGRVLIVGGETILPGKLSMQVTCDSAEIYDPKSGTFSQIGKTSTERWQHTATLLNNGKVLIAGGTSPIGVGTAELFDPQTSSFEPVGNMVVARESHTAELLSDGRVLIVGGLNIHDGYLSSAELFYP